MQFRHVEGFFYGEHFGVYDDAPFVLTIMSEDGALHTQTEVTIEKLEEFSGELSKFIVEVEPLEPNSNYFAMLEKSGTTYEWTFQVAGDLAPVPPPGEFELRLDTYYAQRPITDCCPIEFPGECPTCGTVGSEAVAAASLGVAPLPHAEGPGAWTYHVERRNEAGDWFLETQTATFEADPENIIVEIRGDELRRQRTCFRIIAESIFDADEKLTSNPVCLEGESAFGEPPPGERDPSRIFCGDEIEDPEDPEDPIDTDDPDDPIDLDGDPQFDGQDQIEWGGSAGESDGCGCASTSQGEFPAALLLLMGFLGLRRLL